jgi:phage N-6-adenine-methyltransferase
MKATPNARVIYVADPKVEYMTPASLRLVVNDVLEGFPDLDPATIRKNPIGARYFYTRKDNALARSWAQPTPGAVVRSVYLNPPYGLGIKPWMRAAEEMAELGVRVLLLIPARCGSQWYARATDPLGEHACQVLCEIKGRVTYELPSGKPAPFPARWPSAFLYWGPDRDVVARKLRSVGVVRLCRALPDHLRSPRPPRVDPRQLRLVKS